VWWFGSIIPALTRLRQEGHEFQASLVYIAVLVQPRLHSKNLSPENSKKNNKRKKEKKELSDLHLQWNHCHGADLCKKPCREDHYYRKYQSQDPA
jgi:hypothetical protein